MRAFLKIGLPFALAAAFVLRTHGGTVLTADGMLHEGELGIDHGVAVRGGPAPAKVPFSNILRARFAIPNSSLSPGLLLVNGARIAGSFSPLGEASVRIEAKRITVPSKEIAWVIYQPVTPALAAQAPKAKTGALLPSGDFFEGTVRGGDSSSARLVSTIFGPHTFAPSELLALVLREVQPQPQSAAFDVLTRDGSMYPALDVNAGGGGELTLRHPLYGSLRVPAAELAEIRAGASRMLPLDGVKPTRVDPAPGRDASRCFAANRSLDGNALRLGRRAVAAGFECSAGATVWWKPPPGAGTFFALVSAGAGTPPGQKLTFAVRADGKLVGESPPLGAGDPPAVIRCAVPGAESLVLRIEGAAGSSGTWAEPMLLRR